MSDFTIDMSQLRRLEKSLKKAGVAYEKGTKRLLKDLGERVKKLAQKYAPVSPNKQQYTSELKGGRSRRSAATFTTGSLTDSITTDQGKNSISINVPSNSKAGKYAEKIHDEKGKSWHNRGIGTRRKGQKADEKFIFRAYADEEKNIDKLIDRTIDAFVGDIGV